MPNRIVSLEPSITATIVALGQQHRLIAVSRYCNRLADISNLPQLGTTWSVNAEEVSELEPDLVIAATPYKSGKIDELLKNGLNVLCLYPQKLKDVYNHINMIGNICNAGTEAEKLVQWMQSELVRMAKLSENKPAQKVYIEEWYNPLMTAPMWVSEIVELFGGTVVPDRLGRQIKESEIFDTDPELIIVNWAGIDKIDTGKILNRPGWEDITAIKNRKVVAVNEILLNAPGPNLVEGAKQLLQVMYPRVNN